MRELTKLFALLIIYKKNCLRSDFIVIDGKEYEYLCVTFQDYVNERRSDSVLEKER